ncbi:MAG: aminoacetone oxidase family FAD-binding enzyme, partial [Bacteroidaceae bacterium]|nr:aminoacetone oxidase family FAD-binding enzyme [Bacteroidaceae bacterium]
VEAEVKLAGTKFSAAGPLLMTHWGVSGPAILKLSSYGARFLAESGYRASLVVNWLQRSEEEARAILNEAVRREPGKLVASHAVGALTQRLWTYLTERALGSDVRRWGELNRKEMNRLVTTLTGDVYSISGRGKYKDEFVTAGGIALQGVNPSTLESRHRPGLYFAGEVLDVDGVTGGFNFQAAWTTAYTVARSIAGVGLEVLGRDLH